MVLQILRDLQAVRTVRTHLFNSMLCMSISCPLDCAILVYYKVFNNLSSNVKHGIKN